MIAPTARNARADPGGLALVFGERRWTHAELEAGVVKSVRRMAALGLVAGKRVALLSWNRPELVMLLHAATRLGVTLAPLNARLSDAEVAALLTRLRPDALIADGTGAARSEAGAWPVESRIALDEPPATGWKPWTALPEAPGVVSEHADFDHVHTIMFSSGTSGRAKGILLPWRSHLFSALTSAIPVRASARDRWLLNLPMFHVGGWSIAVRCALLGATIDLHPRLDPVATAAALGTGDVTLASLVAAGLDAALSEIPGGAGRGPRAILVGGGPAPRALLERASRAGWNVRTTYGLTEACSQVTTLDLEDASDPALSAGTPIPMSAVRIVDGERRALAGGEEGAIEVRGPTLLAGYLDEPPGDPPVVDGWLRTGDFGRVDDAGRLTVLARREDLIVSGGENIYPAEIEAVLLGVAGVADAAVLAGTDERWGQVPVALVELRSGESLDPDRLREHLAANLAPFKVPRRIQIVPALPRTGSGKVDREGARKLAGLPSREPG